MQELIAMSLACRFLGCDIRLMDFTSGPWILRDELYGNSLHRSAAGLGDVA
jgi:hypothetical protein